MGLKLQDYTLREKMHLTEKYLHNGLLNTIACVTAGTVMRAGEDEQQKKWLEAMDMVVYCDSDVARAAGITAHNRLKEIENNSFLKEFLKKIVRERRQVYLLADDEGALNTLESELKALQAWVQIAGRAVLHADETEGGVDTIINDINDKAPGVLLSLCDYPYQEAFVQENRGRINASVWLGLQKGCPVHGEEETGIKMLVKKLQRKIFQRKVSKYENQEKAEP